MKNIKIFKIIAFLLVFIQCYIYIAGLSDGELLGSIKFGSFYETLYTIIYLIGYSLCGIIGLFLAIIYKLKKRIVELENNLNNQNKESKNINCLNNYEKLKQLKELLDNKIITKKEFDDEKFKILNK